MSQLLEEMLVHHDARITVIGQGYVGFPLAVAFAQAGFRVNGLDVDPGRVESLRSGAPFTSDVPLEQFETLREAGRYTATTDFDVLKDSDVTIICVPTPLRKSRDPDISYVVEAAEAVAQRVKAGQLVVLESTTYPGTTEELLQPCFEDRGFKVGEDIFLAFSPERIDPGNARFSVGDIPKVVGGVTETCTSLAATLYQQIVPHVVKVSSPKVAELAKLYENVFRSVNIALANEFSLMCRHLDVSSREVIDAAASKPFGFMAFYPGPGIGGHCIPIDPAYLSWKMRFSEYQTRFIQLAEEINLAMPGHVVQLVMESMNARNLCLNGARVLALGVAYKAGVGDIRESPALRIIANLQKRGVDVRYTDPYVPCIQLEHGRLASVPLNEEEIDRADCVLILTDHSDFDIGQVMDRASLVVDTRNATWGQTHGRAEVIRL